MDGIESKPVYWVARGVPVVVGGKRCMNASVQPGTFYDLEAALSSLHAWKQLYPDAILMQSTPAAG